MNNPLSPIPAHPAVPAPRSQRLSTFALMGFFLGLLAVTGCDNHGESASVTLSTRSLADSGTRAIEIHAQVAADQTNLVYKWFADFGSCDPQVSTTPVTTLKFAEGSKDDVVTVEIWRDATRLAQNRLHVKDTHHAAALPLPNVQVQITEIPPAGGGGPQTHATISGTVSGDITNDLRIVIYARDGGVWWIQPRVNTMHTINPDHTWSTWTHTGQMYAALLVRPTFTLLRTFDSLPSAHGDLVARAFVDGKQ
jgi:hypothetical protein